MDWCSSYRLKYTDASRTSTIRGILFFDLFPCHGAMYSQALWCLSFTGKKAGVLGCISRVHNSYMLRHWATLLKARRRRSPTWSLCSTTQRKWCNWSCNLFAWSHGYAVSSLTLSLSSPIFIKTFFITTSPFFSTGTTSSSTLPWFSPGKSHVHLLGSRRLAGFTW